MFLWRLATIIGFLIGITVFSSPIHADPAFPGPITIKQPDGAMLRGFIRGDDFQSWVTTLDGYTMIRNESSGFWEYAVKNSDGSLKSSGIRVTAKSKPPVQVERNIKPPRNLDREQQFNENLRQRQQKRVGSGKIAETWTPEPLKGKQKLLVVRVAFNGGIAQKTNPAIPIANWNRIIFSPTGKSVAKYFQDNSYSNISIVGVSHKQSAVNGIIDIVINKQHPWYLDDGTQPVTVQYDIETAWLRESLKVITDNNLLDIASFDSNGDGYITSDELNIHFIVAGYEQSSSTKIPGVWAHHWSSWIGYSDHPPLTAGSPAKIIAGWSMSGEMGDNGQIEPMGVIAHEFGHQICALPDLYDVSYCNGGLGLFSLMASGNWGADTGESFGVTPVALDAWSRQYLGWATPREVSADGKSLSFPNALKAENSPAMLRNTSLSPTEYFLAENRYPTGWDLGFKGIFGAGWGGGLLILHCDTTVGSGSIYAGNDINDYYYTVINPGTWGHQGIMAEEASSLESPSVVSEIPGIGSAKTLYYSGNASSFTDTTTPNSRYYSGAASGLGLTNISAPGNTMTATAGFPLPVITLISPNGGESWTAGTSKKITWTSSGVTKVTLEYSADDGKTWRPITSSAWASTGSFTWTVPQISSSKCLIRAADYSKATVSDASDTVFTLGGTITVSAPNGGESWTPGISKNITWTCLGISKVRLEYSTNNGMDWTLITAVAPASAGKFAWTVPGAPSSKCLIRASDASNPIIQDQSNAMFSILGTITLTSPNGGEFWTAGTTQNINWSSNGVKNVKLEYSTNNGSAWTTITESTDAATGGLAWNVQGISSTHCLIRASDASNPMMQDKSNATFSILGAITLTSPNGGESWTAGTSKNITWTSSGISKVTLQYSIDSGKTWRPIAFNALGASGSYTWIVPQVSSKKCLIRAADYSKATVYDASDAVFSILPATMTLTAPNGVKRWISGGQNIVTWNTSSSEQSGAVSDYRIYRSLSITPSDSVKSLDQFTDTTALTAWEQHASVLVDSVTAGRTEYTDTAVYDAGAVYYYWIQAVGAGGESAKIPAGNFKTVTGQSAPPTDFRLGDAHPNPFNPATTIEYSVPRNTRALLQVYNITGQKVATLVDGAVTAGLHSAVWVARGMPSGVYFYSLRTEDGASETKKVMLLK